MTKNKKYIFLILFIGSLGQTIAQKLPSVQQVSLYAPADVKIDGKTTEWNDKFQAYNYATDIFYTICNDDNYLYLVVQVTDPHIITKVISGGITFTVSNTLEKNKQKHIEIIYPIFEPDKKPNLSLKNKPEIIPGSVISMVRADSFMNANNKRLSDKSKYILVNGINGMDSLVSVYNTDGIKTAELFDNRMKYNYELSVSLKNLGISTNTTKKINYNIRLNGLNGHNMDGISVKADPATGVPLAITISPGAIIPTKAERLELVSPTDFSGEYTLAKKP